MSQCPICKKTSKKETKPFCSKGCKSIDLNRWLSGAYRVPGEPVSPDHVENSVEDKT